MMKIYLAVLIASLAGSSFACECHDSAGFSGAFGSFAGWQLPNSSCIPTHDLASGTSKEVEEGNTSDSNESTEGSAAEAKKKIEELPDFVEPS